MVDFPFATSNAPQLRVTWRSILVLSDGNSSRCWSRHARGRGRDGHQLLHHTRARSHHVGPVALRL